MIQPTCLLLAVGLALPSTPACPLPSGPGARAGAHARGPAPAARPGRAPGGVQARDRAQPREPAPARGAAAARDDTAGPQDAPPLTPAARQELDRAIKALRTGSQERRADAVADVVAFGRAALPVLLEAAGTSHPAQQAGVVECLAALADERDAGLAAGALASPHVALRRFGARMAAQLGTPELLDAAEGALEDDDHTARLEAALALVTHGRDEGLLVLAEAFDPGWQPTAPGGAARTADPDPDPEAAAAAAAERSAWQPRILAALPGVADKSGHRDLVWRLRVDPERERTEPGVAAAERLVAVRLLHAIGDDAACRGLVRALGDPHNLVQRAAIDALRDLLEGAGPFEGRSIFEQIREAERLGQLAEQQHGR